MNLKYLSMEYMMPLLHLNMQGAKKTKSAEDGMIEWMNASAQRFSVILCLQSTSNN